MILPMLQKIKQEGGQVPRLANTKLVPNDYEIVIETPNADKTHLDSTDTLQSFASLQILQS